jgi:integrase
VEERRNGAGFGDAVERWLEYVETDRKRRRATVRDYEQLGRLLVGEFGAHTPVADVTTERVEAWRARLVAEGRLSARSINKRLVALHAVFGVAGITPNPVAGVKRQPLSKKRPLDFHEPEEAWALIRSADGDTDAAAVALGTLAGLRMAEVLGLRWRDVDFAADTIRVAQSYSAGGIEPTKSGDPRAVPMIPDLAALLARLSQRERFTDPDDPVCPAADGRHQDDSAFRKRYYSAQRRAGLRRLTFHQLRHTFGCIAIRVATPVEVQEWMGHADLSTTQQYLHYKPRADAARRLGEAFSPQGSPNPLFVGLPPVEEGPSPAEADRRRERVLELRRRPR